MNSLEALDSICKICNRHGHCFIKENNKRCVQHNLIEKDLKAFEIIKEQIKKNNCIVIIKEPELCSKEDSDLLKECLK